MCIYYGLSTNYYNSFNIFQIFNIVVLWGCHSKYDGTNVFLANRPNNDYINIHVQCTPIK